MRSHAPRFPRIPLIAFFLHPLCLVGLVGLTGLMTAWPVPAAPGEVIEDAQRHERADPRRNEAAAERLAELQKRLAELQSHLPEDFRIRQWWRDDPAIRRLAADGARQLSLDVAELAFDHPEFTYAQGSGWFRLHSDAGRLNRAFNVTRDPAEAVAHAKEILTKLAPGRRHMAPQMWEQVFIRPTDRIVTRIGRDAPQEVVELVRFTEEVLAADLARNVYLRQSWLRLKGRRGSVVISRYPDLIDPEPWQVTMVEWWREFLENEPDNLRNKENEIISLAIGLHTRGRSAEALVWLRWLEAQPEYEAWDSVPWLSHAFFASWIGVGDRQAGQQYFDRLQQLMAEDANRSGRDLFRGVTSSYYSQLHKSDVQHRTDALRESAERFERSFPDARR